MPTSREYARWRNRMVDEQLVKRGINDRRVLDAMRVMPRHVFLPEEFKPQAYEDRPAPIGEGQTISQPYIVAFMTERLRLKPHHTVLEIGTGSGYQTAILCHLCHYVYSVERVSRLADQAGGRIGDLGYNNIEIYVGDGSQGLPDQATFDRIMVTAAVPRLPNVLCGQLDKHGGQMILPIGDEELQELTLVTRRGERFASRTLLRCRFVPLIGRFGFDDDVNSQAFIQ
ncbi:MAG: protein-L-isoaspartate(D-aspartate) O-methyltransferase [Chloroflexota bacterium]|nr:protein-L-isoaspartate(D-aspartate) O-methyltransferase [Chloroflexota bacterium]MDE2854772.1 protein-L-isoaspartate(D-aspartate) O-methyltransferase [Chloroflexota bacterium]MDE2946830.1 protein-L-isoaspartate(D-aspartate) O-methyltransferase [Chloroflexota bacterium]